MSYRREQFVNNGIYHVVTRAMDTNLLFKNIDDYYRGIFSIYEFNNAKSVEIVKRRKEIQAFKNRIKRMDGGPTSSQLGGGLASAHFSENSENQNLIQVLKMPDDREKLVDVFCFSLMPNHVHLLLRQIQDNGITQFMQKFGTGYGGYFNRKYKRKGHVFQNKFVSVQIKTDVQLKIVFVYIHINSTSLIEPKWKEKGIKNIEKVIKFLENEFRWSSCFDYIGKKNFPSVAERGFILKVMGGEQGCKDAIEDWIRYKGEVSEFSDFIIE